MLDVQQIAKRFDNGHEALGRISLSVREGEILAVIGASGCGKSTLLRLIAGLDAPSEGRILLDGAPLAGPSPKVGMVFQEPRLMPWLRVLDNVAFGLHRTLPRTERARRAAVELERVGLSRFADALPKHSQAAWLSGPRSLEPW